MMDFTAGIDVGGKKKGYHLAIKGVGEKSIYSVTHAVDPETILRIIKSAEGMLNGRCLAVGIDAPRKAKRSSQLPRPAELSIRRLGYRVIWTPQESHVSYEWMENGELLWRVLQAGLNSYLLECFPSMLSDQLNRIETVLPLGLLSGYSGRKYYADYLDSVFCAVLAENHILKNTIDVGTEVEISGIQDEQGPITILNNPVTRKYVLCIIHTENEILLGMKKKGFGEGKWNGFGGKIEEFDKGKNQQETLENAIRREVHEECGLTLKSLERRGKIFFTFYDNGDLLEVDVFRSSDFTGKISESDEMIPQWFPVDKIPYEKMWKDDPVWLPHILQNRSFNAYFFFNGQEVIHYAIELSSS